MTQCPLCRKPSDPKIHPFCSDRCKMVDLHRWLSGTYAVAVDDEPLKDGDPGETE